MREDGNCVDREELALDEYRQLAISNREEGRVYRAVDRRICGSYTSDGICFLSEIGTNAYN